MELSGVAGELRKTSSWNKCDSLVYFNQHFLIFPHPTAAFHYSLGLNTFVLLFSYTQHNQRTEKKKKNMSVQQTLATVTLLILSHADASIRYSGAILPSEFVHSRVNFSTIFQCVDGFPYLNRCPSGLHFDDIQKFCTFKNEARCGPIATSKSNNTLHSCQRWKLVLCSVNSFTSHSLYFYSPAASPVTEAPLDLAQRCDLSECQLPYCYCSKDGTNIPKDLNAEEVSGKFSSFFWFFLYTPSLWQQRRERELWSEMVMNHMEL